MSATSAPIAAGGSPPPRPAARRPRSRRRSDRTRAGARARRTPRYPPGGRRASARSSARREPSRRPRAPTGSARSPRRRPRRRRASRERRASEPAPPCGEPPRRPTISCPIRTGTASTITGGATGLLAADECSGVADDLARSRSGSTASGARRPARRAPGSRSRPGARAPRPRTPRRIEVVAGDRGRDELRGADRGAAAPPPDSSADLLWAQPVVRVASRPRRRASPSVRAWLMRRGRRRLSRLIRGQPGIPLGYPSDGTSDG